jgi:serine/threonine protein kinase
VPKIADFGLSKHEDKEQQDLLSDKTTNIGTPIYMAPELMTAEASSVYGSKVDVYAFAILMWAVLTRTRPYESSVMKKRLTLWALVSECAFL